MKRWAVLGLLLASSGVSAGCWDRIEVNDLALVTGASIDKHDDKSIELTVQIFVPQGGAGDMESASKGGGGSENTFIQSALGTNIADAMSHLQEKISRQIFWGHSEIFLFGEEAARSGIRDDIDFLLRAPQPRERAFLYVTEGRARHILELQTLLERNTSEVLREMSKSKLATSVTLSEFSAMLAGDSGAALMPWVKPLPPLSEKEPLRSAGYIDGTAVFRDDKLVGRIDETTSRGVLWLRDEINDAVITVKPPGSDGTVSMRMIKSRTNIVPHIEDGKWSLNVHIHTENDALQNTTSMNLVSDYEAIHKVENSVNQDIEKRVKLALEQLQKKMKADIFDFAGEFHRKYPKEWKLHKDEWDEIFPKLEVTIETGTKMLRPGLSSVEATSPDKEEAK